MFTFSCQDLNICSNGYHFECALTHTEYSGHPSGSPGQTSKRDIRCSWEERRSRFLTWRIDFASAPRRSVSRDITPVRSLTEFRTLFSDLCCLTWQLPTCLASASHVCIHLQCVFYILIQDHDFSARKDTVLPLSTSITGIDGREMHDIIVPKGTTVIVSIINSNRDPALWGPDSYEWKPERWLSPLPDTIREAPIPGIYSHMWVPLCTVNQTVDHWAWKDDFHGRWTSMHVSVFQIPSESCVSSWICSGFKFSELEMSVWFRLTPYAYYWWTA